MVPEEEHDVANGGEGGGEGDVGEAERIGKNVHVEGGEVEDDEMRDGIEGGEGAEGDGGEELAAPDECQDEQGEKLVEEELVEEGEHAEGNGGENDGIEDVGGDELEVGFAVGDAFLDQVGEAEHAGLGLPEGVGGERGGGEDEENCLDDDADLEAEGAATQRRPSSSLPGSRILAPGEVVGVARALDADAADVSERAQSRIGDDGVRPGGGAPQPRTEVAAPDPDAPCRHAQLLPGSSRQLDHAAFARVPVEMRPVLLVGARLLVARRLQAPRPGRDRHAHHVDARLRLLQAVSRQLERVGEGRALGDVAHVESHQHAQTPGSHERTHHLEDMPSAHADEPAHGDRPPRVDAEEHVLEPRVLVRAMKSH
mmetsp:Transcript_24309/g.75966  ORF Transcript_24309/g.75966 Transcript_24309/m.75966 type:complete len:370 (-) Transcript_24309:108-1217(-)